MISKYWRKALTSIYFSNIFLIFLSLALNIETVIKIGLPFNTIEYYVLVTSATVLFYLYAYRIPKNYKYSNNIRIQFYIQNRKFIQIFTYVISLCFIYSVIKLFNKSIQNLHIISWQYIIILLFTAILAFSYYDFNLGISLRKKMWLKPILIGWTWSIATVFLPILFFMLETNTYCVLDIKFYYLFFQNFMFCLINAILFDLKDYEDDSNRNLKTFVVKYGYYFTLNKIILPLIFIGFLSFISFALWQKLNTQNILFTLIPIFGLAIFSFKLKRPKPILYYLIAIDGMIFLKAICGIFSVILFEK